MIAAIYARKSNEQNGVSDEVKSVARQIAHARDYAVRKGWSVGEDHIYIDDGISGAEFSRRPGFLRLMTALKPKPPFDVLVMSEESRLGREAIETSYALKQLLTAGVHVWFYLTDTERTLNSPMEKAMLSLQALADEMERERARQRTRDALQRKAKAGHVAGGRVFGYDNVDVLDATGKRSHVERRINQAEGAVVRRMFELAARGLGARSIAKQLNEERALCPRSQRGRPRAWAPSSVRAVLYRDLYRGEVAWGKTRKRDNWGHVKPQDRPESEWLRVSSPNLRIVSDKLWSEAHRQLREKGKAYLRGTDGRLWGRPVSGIESKYLLPGIARCAVCNGGLLVRSRSHGRHRQHFYACSTFHQRGRCVCGNDVEDVMKTVDDAVLDALENQLLGEGMLDEILDVAVAQLEPAKANVRTDRAASAQALERVETEIANLTAAIVAGGELSTLIAALKAREAERDRLQKQLAQARVTERRVEVTPTRLREELAARFADWRGVLRRQPQLARQIVKKLVDGPIRFTPKRDATGRGYFEFEAEGTFAKMLGNLGSISVASPTGFEPVFWP
jgi:site-specific DNA recombinase